MGDAARHELDRLDRWLRGGSVCLVLATVIVLAVRLLFPASGARPRPVPAAEAAAPAASLPAGIAAVESSYAYGGDTPERAFDGVIQYAPGGQHSRWACWGSGHPEDWIAWRLMPARTLARIDVYFFADDKGTTPPSSVRVEYRDAGEWRPVDGLTSEPERPIAAAVNVLRFAPVTTSELRLLVVHQPGSSSAISEIALPE